MDKERVADRTLVVVRREAVVDSRDRCGDEARKDEGDDQVVRDKDVDKDGVQDADDGETPADEADAFVRRVKELVDDKAKQQDVAVGSVGRLVSALAVHGQRPWRAHSLERRLARALRRPDGWTARTHISVQVLKTGAAGVKYVSRP